MESEQGGVWERCIARAKKEMPSIEALKDNKWMKPVAHHIGDERLWKADRESVARGVAIGIFWAFALPIGQVVAAAAHCIWWRGNIPMAAGSTFITNPLTFGFWLYLAYSAGSSVLGGTDGVKREIPSISEGVLKVIEAVGWPTIVGMGMFAVAGAAAAYVLVHSGACLWSGWRRVHSRRRKIG